MNKATLFLVCLLSTFCFSSFAQQQYNFIHIDPNLKNSTKQTNINHIFEDQLGYILLCHKKGIERYDGYQFSHTNIQEFFPAISSEDFIQFASKDAANSLWVTSNHGLLSTLDTLGHIREIPNKGYQFSATHIAGNDLFASTFTGTVFQYNYQTQVMDSITTLPKTPGLSSKIKHVKKGKNQRLYISTYKGKLYQYNLLTGQLKNVKLPIPSYEYGIALELDLHDRLWVGTENFGIFLFDTRLEKFDTPYTFLKEVPGLNSSIVMNLLCDSEGNLWVGTDGDGLYHLELAAQKYSLFTHDPLNKFSLPTNTVVYTNEDRHGNMWVATNYGGLNVLPKSNKHISYYSGSKNKTPERVLSILKTKTDLWIGTDGNGITKISFNNNSVQKKEQFFNNTQGAKGFYVQSILEDPIGNIWMGTYKNGLWHYNTVTQKFKPVPLPDVIDVRKLFQDSKNRIWVSTDVALYVFDQNLREIAKFPNHKNGLGAIVKSMAEIKDYGLWLGCDHGGIFQFIEQSPFHESYFVQYELPPNRNDIHDIQQADNDHLWLVDLYGKIASFNLKTKKHRVCKDFGAFKNEAISSLLIENERKIWLATKDRGIFSYDLQTSLVQSYYEIDGLQGNNFIRRSAFKDPQGTLYFGGLKGVSSISPNAISKSEITPQLYINDIKVLNRPIRKALPEQSKEGVHQLQTLQLDADESSFSFKFSAIGNILAPNFFYSYRLKGFDQEWKKVTADLQASYTNIPDGNYTFEVRASNNKDTWNIPTKRIAITIAKPWYKSHTAFGIYACILILIYLAFRKWYHLKNHLILQRLHHQNEKELQALKMDFFAKMSHEIQTPITLITGPIDHMIQKAEEDGDLLLKERLEIIQNNAHRLSRIAFELTTLRNKELNTNKLRVTQNNLLKDFEKICTSFNEEARHKNIDFNLLLPNQLNETWYDRDKIEHILFNLLANSFKFTPSEGVIQLVVEPINHQKAVKITVSDTGIGIPKHELDKIFKLFYQSPQGVTAEGSGIGLALAKDFMDLHRGDIHVESAVDEGTTFILTLPIIKTAYRPEEISEVKTSDDHAVHSGELAFQENKKTHDKTLLIVEDNYQLREFLRAMFHESYNVLVAEDGERGLEIAQNIFPDLIISDIMMPKLDGISLCKKLNEHVATQHIPVILLTAKNSSQTRISGLESGAIEFIRKPFNSHELLLKVHNILQAKEHIISKYKTTLLNSPLVIEQQSPEEIFMANLVSAINNRLDTPNFKIEALASDLNMSYSALYRKCQSITGESLVDLVRSIRLTKGAIILAKYQYNISEAAYQCGFNDPKYFSKCFKKKFGIPPNSFRKEAQEITYEELLEKYQLVEQQKIPL